MLKDSENSTTYIEKQGCEISHERNNVYEWDVPEGEYIKQIEVRTGNAVDAITFITNTGKKSPQFGGNGGGYNLINIPRNCRLCGYFGRTGHENAINKLGFFYNEWN